MGACREVVENEVKYCRSASSVGALKNGAARGRRSSCLLAAGRHERGEDGDEPLDEPWLECVEAGGASMERLLSAGSCRYYFHHATFREHYLGSIETRCPMRAHNKYPEAKSSKVAEELNVKNESKPQKLPFLCGASWSKIALRLIICLIVNEAALSSVSVWLRLLTITAHGQQRLPSKSSGRSVTCLHSLQDLLSTPRTHNRD